MTDELPLLLAGESVVLVGARALYWPARQALLIADLHLGKADVFRRAGIALPSGGTGEDLQRLQRLLDLHACRELWILGDILHGPAHRAAWQAHRQGGAEQLDAHRDSGLGLLDLDGRQAAGEVPGRLQDDLEAAVASQGADQSLPVHRVKGDSGHLRASEQWHDSKELSPSEQRLSAD